MWLVSPSFFLQIVLKTPRVQNTEKAGTSQ